MCGICGFVDLSRSTGEGELLVTASAMAATMAHRGPDDEGVWADAASGVVLGQRRLAVIDLSDAGHQPMVSPSGRYVLVYNGEIYNHPRLSARLAAEGYHFRGHSDSEVLLTAIDAWGVEAALERCNGMFAIALWDTVDQKLLLARDRLGEKPMAWGRMGSTVLFGSELKALRAHPACRPEIDRDAAALFFRHKYIPAPHSIYRGIEKVMPGEIVRIDRDGVVRRSRYWNAFDHVPTEPTPTVAVTEAIDELEELLLDAVRVRMIADVPLGAFLSGGIDSATVVALMQQVSAGPVRTFTIGNADPRFDESAAAAAIARHLGTEHTTLEVTEREAIDVVSRLPDIYDEPFADSSQIPTFLVSHLARRDVTVSLSGDGGDELFGGYNRYRWVPAIWERLHRVPVGLRRVGAKGLAAVPPQWWDHAVLAIPERRRPRLASTKVAKLAAVAAVPSAEDMFLRLTSHWPDPAALVLGAREPTTVVSDPGSWPEGRALADRLMAVDLVSYLPDDILVKLDRASMAVSLEGRVPLLDHRVVEHALGIPGEWKQRDGQAKWILRQVAERSIPASLLDQPKMGFGVPVGDWMRGPLQEWAGSLLAPERLRSAGLLDADLVEQRWREHLAGRRDHTYQLWDVVMFQAWHERWA